MTATGGLKSGGGLKQPHSTKKFNSPMMCGWMGQPNEKFGRIVPAIFPHRAVRCRVEAIWVKPIEN
jgi:hypothetical protein